MTDKTYLTRTGEPVRGLGAKILQLLEGGPMTAIELGRALGTGAGHVAAYAKCLVAQGHVKRAGKDFHLSSQAYERRNLQNPLPEAPKVPQRVDDGGFLHPRHLLYLPPPRERGARMVELLPPVGRGDDECPDYAF